MATKICSNCKIEKDLDNDFHVNKASSDGKGSYCKVCARAKAKQWAKDNPERVIEAQRKRNEKNEVKVKADAKVYRTKNRPYFRDKCRQYYYDKPKKSMLYECRKRAKKFGIPCTITEDDIIIPEFCPILGIELIRGATINNRDNAPSMDRIVPELGYIPGNIAVMSFRANRLKNDGNIEEIRKVLEWLEKHHRAQLKLVA